MVKLDKKYTQGNCQNFCFRVFFQKTNLSPTFTLFISTIIFFLSCQRSDKETDNSLSEFRTAIDSLYQVTIPPDDPGSAVLVSYKGKKLIGKGFGLRNLETKEPVTASTNFRIASVSKQFTVLCILNLMDNGKLCLNDSVQKYLPYPVFKNMTIEHLINHTSGLPSFDDYFLNHWDRTRIVENKDVLDWLLTNPKLDFNSGEGWEYSNTAYLMLALIVEKLSGMEFSAYAKKNVFHPLGMDSTNYYSLANPILIPERAFCYEKDSTGRYEKVDGFFMNGIMGDGAVYTSINDYYNYDLALRKKKFLSETTQELLFKPSSTNKKNGRIRHYAMGWHITDSTAYHTGGWIGANAFAIRYLNEPLTVVIFMNKNTLFTSGLIDKTLNLTQAYLNKNNH